MIKPSLGTLLNRSHPLAAGLRFAFIFNEGTGDNIHDLAGNLAGTLTGMIPADDWQQGTAGRGLFFDGLDHRVIVPNSTSLTADLGGLTLFATVEVSGNPGANWGRFIHKARGTTKDDYSLAISLNREVVARVTTNVTTTINGTTQMVIGPTIYNTAMTWNGSTMRVWLDGVEENSVGTVSSLSDDAQDLGIGGFINDNTRRFHGKIYNSYMWNRALDKSELMRLQYDPYAMFRYGRPPLFVSVGIALTKVSNSTVNWGEGTVRIGHSSRVINSAVTWAENIVRLGTTKKIINSTVTWAENVAKISGITKVFNSTVTWAENVVRIAGVTRVINSTVTWAESAIRLGASKIVISSTVTWAENIIRLGTIKKVFNSTVTWAENIVRFGTTKKIINSTITWVENAVKIAGVTRVINSTVSWAENALRISGLIKTINSTVAWAENIVRAGTIKKIINSTATWAENIIRFGTIKKVFSSTVSWGENVVRVSGLIKIINSTVTWAENAIKVLSSVTAITKVINESVTWSESVVKTLLVNLHRLFMENVSTIKLMKNKTIRKFLKWIN